MTISAAYHEDPYRLFENVLNLVEFDCYVADLDCLERTKATRSDFAPYIQMVLQRTQYELSLELSFRTSKYMPTTMPDFLKNYICGTLVHTCLNSSMLINLAKVYDNNKSIALTKNLIRELAKEFRAPKGYFSDKINKFLSDQDLISDIRHSWGSASCHNAITQNNLTTKGLIYATSIARILGCSHDLNNPEMGYSYDVNNELKLGQLLSYHSLQTPSGVPVQRKVSNFLPSVAGAKVPFTALSLFRYIFGPYETMSGQKTLGGISCPMSNSRKVNPQYQKVHCLSMPNSTCCELEKAVSEHVTPMFKLLKYSIAPQSKVTSDQGEVDDALTLAESLGYSLKLDKRVVNTSPIIAACKFGNGKLTKDCDLFSKTFTTKGLGYSFNVDNFWQIYQNTSMTQAFYKEVHEQSHINGQKLLSNDRGQDYGLQLYIRHVGAPYQTSLYPYNSMPTMTIHNPASIPDFGANSLELAPGLIYDITVTPHVTVTDRDVFNLDKSHWNCLPASETGGLKRFKNYNQQNCVFECRLDRAVQTCNCTPWDFPNVPEETPICHYHVNSACFLPTLKESTDPLDCDCPTDCDSVDYSAIPFTSSLENVYRRGPTLKKYSYRLCIHRKKTTSTVLAP